MASTCPLWAERAAVCYVPAHGCCASNQQNSHHFPSAHYCTQPGEVVWNLQGRPRLLPPALSPPGVLLEPTNWQQYLYTPWNSSSQVDTIIHKDADHAQESKANGNHESTHVVWVALVATSTTPFESVVKVRSVGSTQALQLCHRIPRSLGKREGRRRFIS